MALDLSGLTNVLNQVKQGVATVNTIKKQVTPIISALKPSVPVTNTTTNTATVVSSSNSLKNLIQQRGLGVSAIPQVSSPAVAAATIPVNNTKWWVIGGAGFVLIIVIVFVLIRK